MNRFYRLLAFGYFPKEIPPVFWTGDFATAVGRIQSSLATHLSQTWSKPSPYLLQQRARYRRPLSLPNPNAYIRVANIIANQYTAIQTHFSRSPFSLSSPKFNRKTKFFRAVGPNLSGDDLRLRKLALRAKYPVIVHFDAKNFYRSVYTHSIEWADVGKAAAKVRLRTRAPGGWGKELDDALRTGQDGQTIGIPVGPDTSFIVGEVLLTSIDRQLGYDSSRALRFYDDYEIGASSEGEAQQILEKAESVFSELELELNPEKSKILPNSENLDTTWRLHIKLATKEKPRRPEDLVDLFALACSLARDNPEDFVLRYFVRRMRMFVLHQSLWKAWQEILMATTFAEVGALRTIYEQLDLYEKIGYTIDKAVLSTTLKDKLKRELRGSVSSELSWILFGFLKFGVSIEAEAIHQVIERGDDISRILAIKLAVEQGRGVKRRIQQLLATIGPVDPVSEHWLLFWEIYRNEWSSDRTLRTALTREPIFQVLDNESVSFLREPEVDLLEIPSPFKEEIETLHGAAEATRLVAEIQKTFATIAADVTDEEEEVEEDDEDDDGETFY